MEGLYFRLGLDDWYNGKEFTPYFTLLVEEYAAVYFLVYHPGPNSTDITTNTIRFGLGIQPDGNWHVISRDLATEFEVALPNTQLLSVLDFYVYGSIHLDNLMLLDPKSEK